MPESQRPLAVQQLPDVVECGIESLKFHWTVSAPALRARAAARILHGTGGDASHPGFPGWIRLDARFSPGDAGPASRGAGLAARAFRRGGDPPFRRAAISL